MNIDDNQDNSTLVVKFKLACEQYTKESKSDAERVCKNKKPKIKALDSTL